MQATNGLTKECKMIRKSVILALVAVGATLAAGAAQAGVHWSVGINLPVPVYGAPVYSAPVPVYAAPAYYDPAPVYYEPAPVYRRPYPVYVRPVPVVYPRYYRGWHDHDRRGHWEHRAWR